MIPPEYERFCSESQIEFQNLQTRIIKEYLKVPVTTNGTGLATNSINYYESYKELTEYTFDYYPNLRNSRVDSFPYAFARGIKENNKFGVMEFVSGGGHKLGGEGRLQPNPGAMKQAAVHSLACGSNMMLHFQFRSFPFGAEQLNYAIVDLDGVPRRRYREMCDTAKLINKLSEIEDADFFNEVAICFDYDSHWALKIKPINDPKFKYINNLGKIYHAFEKIGVTSNVVSIDGNWEKYKIVVIPTAIILSKENQDRIRNFVKEGGTVISTFLTSVKNTDNVGYTDVLPAGLVDVFGSSVEEVEPVFDNHTKIRLRKQSYEAWCHMDETEDSVLETYDDMWSELLGGPSEAMGTYIEDYKEGMKVISAHTYGVGRAYYIGTDIPIEMYSILFEGIVKESKVHSVKIKRNENVEVISRKNSDKEFAIIFNFSAKATEIELYDEWTDHDTKEHVFGKIIIGKNGFKILER